MSARSTGKRLYWLAALMAAALLGALAPWAAQTPALRRKSATPKPAPQAGRTATGARAIQERAFWQELAQLAREEESARSAQTGAAAAERHPHPVSADHQRLYRDVDLLQAADEAIAQQRYADARRLLTQHHAELPGMSPLEEEGLWLLVDCAEERSPENLARVQDFYDHNSASTVRRRLRRACLEREP